MKRIILLFLLLIPRIVFSQGMFNPDDLNSIAREDRDHFVRKQFQKRSLSSANFDVQWYRCEWKIDPAVDSISGCVTTLFKILESGTDSISLDLSAALAVDSVVYHKQQIAWTHTGEVLSLQFPAALPAFFLDSISVWYQGIPPDNGFGSFVKDTHNGTPIIWTLSEPYGASDWWPCKNGLTDKSDSIDLYITTPSGYKAASNGILVSSVATGTWVTYHWKHRYPIATYLVCLGVTNYSVFTQQVPFGADLLNVVNYVYPEDSASVVTQTDVVVSMIQVYDSLFGIYPFQREKYGNTQFGWGGGMENQTMTFVTSFGFELLAHELGHQWFGDKVTCGSWSDIWLNEGFATYLSGLCYEHLLPNYWQRFREVRIRSIMTLPGGSVYCTDTTNISRIFDSRLSYAKGALILHQLRWLLGDSAFFAALQNYISDPMLAYGFARTADLKRHLEASSGEDLSWYFDEWFTGEGYPTYQVAWTQGQDSVRLTLGQTQSHPSVSFFRMSVPLKFKNETRDTLIRFYNTFSGQPFSVYIPFTVDSIIVDPDFQLIAGNHLLTSVNEPVAPPRISAYPNPANREIRFFTGSLQIPQGAKIIIYDDSGRVMDELTTAPAKNEYLLDTRNYLPGLYFYSLPAGDARQSGKFVIMR
jgi:aminopeptidase N